MILTPIVSLSPGYARDPLPLSDLLATAGLATFSLEAVLQRVLARCRSRWRVLARRCLLFLLVLATLLAISRQHVSQWRRIHPQLYRWRQVPNFGAQVQQLLRKHCHLSY